MDDFAQAAVYSFAADADPSLFSQANVYYENLKQCDQGFLLCLGRLVSNQDANLQEHVWYIRYFCLRIIEEYVSSDRYVNLRQDEKVNIRTQLIQWISGSDVVENIPVFCSGKLAQVFAMLFKREYLTTWPTFFNDLLALVPRGKKMATFFIRINENIHSEIVDKQICRSQAELDHNTNIKDQMRAENTKHLAEAWYSILFTYQKSDPQLVSSCLNVVGFFVSWIDVNLIVNPTYLQLLYTLLENLEIQDSACACLTAIIDKGMPASNKIQLIENLGILNVVPNLVNQPQVKGEEETQELLTKLAMLMATVCKQLVLSSSDNSCFQVLDKALPLLCYFLEHEVDDISMEALWPLKDYIGLLKTIKNNNNGLPDVHLQHMDKFIIVLIKKLEYDVEYNFEQRGEDEAFFENFRKDLMKTLMSFASVDDARFFAHVENCYTTTLNNLSSAPFADVEVVLKLFYVLIEAISSKLFIQEEIRIIQMLNLLFSSQVVKYQHVSVTMVYFDIFARYSSLFANHPEFIGYAIDNFFSEYGVSNPSPMVRGQVCYNLVKFVKPLRDNLKNSIDPIIAKLTPMLQLSADIEHLVFEDQSWLYEVVGLLASAKSLDLSKQESFYRSVAQPLFSSFKQVIDSKVYLQNPEQGYPYCGLLCRVMELMSKLSAAIDPEHPCVPFFVQGFELFSRIFEVPVMQQKLCLSLIKYLHRMIECLRMQIIPRLPNVLAGLLQTGDFAVVSRVLNLLSQVCVKMKKQIVEYLDSILMLVIGTVFQLLNAPYDIEDQDCVQQVMDLKIDYFKFLATIASNDLIEVFISPTNMPHLDSILQTAVLGLTEPSEPQVQVRAGTFLKVLVSVWASPDAGNNFTRYLLDQVVGQSIASVLNPKLNVEDAGSMLVVDEVSALQKQMYKSVGPQLVEYSASNVFPALEFNEEMTQAYCQNMTSLGLNEGRGWRNFFRQFVKARRSQQI